MSKQKGACEHLTYRAALAQIYDRSGYDRGFISNPFAGDDAARLGLARTSAILKVLGNPHERVRLFHIAGTKGKGSTAVLMDSILRAAGMRSGRFTSPHLHSYRERFIVDDQLISEEAFAAATGEIMSAIRNVESNNPELGSVTAWELSTAMALHWFAQAGCEVAVIEVGLGGTLDATNVIDPVVSAITRLDLEHTAILGETLPEIASNKAGIIKPERPAITVTQGADALAVIEARARDVGSSLLVQDRDWFVEGAENEFAVVGPWGSQRHLRTSLIGQHQVENAALAVAAIELAFGHGSSIHPSAIQEGLLSASHPGRFERVSTASGRTVIIDGAHTPIAAEALRDALVKHVPGERVTVVAGMLDDKHPEQFLRPLIRLAARWIVTEPNSPRRMPIELLATALDRLGQRVEQVPSVAEAIESALADDNVVVVAGSMSMAAEARVHLGLAVQDVYPR